MCLFYFLTSRLQWSIIFLTLIVDMKIKKPLHDFRLLRLRIQMLQLVSLHC